MQETTTHQWVTSRREGLRASLVGRNLSRLADESGVSRTTLWRIREGRTQPDTETMTAIERVLADG